MPSVVLSRNCTRYAKPRLIAPILRPRVGRVQRCSAPIQPVRTTRPWDRAMLGRPFPASDRMRLYNDSASSICCRVGVVRTDM